MKGLAYSKSLLYWPRLKNYRPFPLYGSMKLVRRKGEVEIGSRTAIWPGVKFSVISKTPNQMARLTIGKGCSIGDRTQIHCSESVTIGDGVLISWDVNILETYYHNVSDGSIRESPIVIEDKTWIGCRAIILSGVRIGQGAVVGAGAVVTESVESGMLVAGNPAKPIRKTGHWV